jgi:hypothetical protein
MRFYILVATFLLVSSYLHASKKIVINLSEQKAYAMENDKVVFQGEISSGKKGRETPNGRFKIMEKKKKHVSNLWPKNKNGTRGGAKMPFMMRLTNTGYSMHLGYTPKYAASHGCIRLKNGFAQKMYRWASVGTPVKIKGKAPARKKVTRTKRKKSYASVSFSSSGTRELKYAKGRYNFLLQE